MMVSMTGDVSLLTNLQGIVSRLVSFADCSQLMATRTSCLRLSAKVTLPNVLFVSSLNCTLLSVAELLIQTSYFAKFIDTLCVLQDHFARILIGVGEERDGVYIYRDVRITRGHIVKAAEDQALWHRRLGHPSYGVLGFLSFISGVKNVSDKFEGCDIVLSLNKLARCFPRVLIQL